jgi:hypothetical protein
MVTLTAAADLLNGRKSKRLEAAVTPSLDAEIVAAARELAGPDGNPKMFKSEATRVLLAEAIVARRKLAARKA